MTEDNEVMRFVRRYRKPLIAALCVVAGVAVLLIISQRSFTPQYYYTELVGSTDIEDTFDIAKGQTLKMRYLIDPGKEEVVVVVRQGTVLSSGKIQTGYIMKDEPRVSDGDVVRFKAPHSGTYVVTMRTRSGNLANVRVEYSLSD